MRQAQRDSQGRYSSGSGVCVGFKNGRAAVLTCRHVTGSQTRAVITLADGRIANATVLRDEDGYDLVLCEFEIESVPGVALVAGEAPAKGERITLAGFGGGRWKELAGSVLGYVGPGVPGGAQRSTRNGYELAITAESISGDSGGPIFNSKGETVGILWGGPQQYQNGPMIHTQCASQPALRTFLTKCGWLIGPDIRITVPPAAAAPVMPSLPT